MSFYVYMLASDNNGMVYTGVTNNLVRRIYEHKTCADPKSYTAKYKVHKLVYYEQTSEALVAISREKQMKSWTREKKNRLISGFNPTWKDLYPDICG